MKSIKEIISFYEEQEGSIQSKERKGHSLERFVEAQELMYPMAFDEVRNGRKRGHWIWYIFPQLKGLGMSENSQYSGIDGIKEARAYLQHPVLGARLREITTAFLELVGKNAQEVFGHLDAMKVCSCMTLFNEVSDDDLFQKVLDRYYNGVADDRTLEMLVK